MDSKISVLIGTKNRKELLEKALGSVLAQTLLPDEVVIVNDGSTDDTKIFLEGFKNQHPSVEIIISHREKSGGINAARNQGIQLSKASWIMFLDDDDELVPDAVFKAKEVSKNIPSDYFLFFFNTLIKTDTDQYVGGFQFTNGSKYYDPTYEEVILKTGLKGDCRPVFRRSLFEEKKYTFPESVNGFESFVISLMAKNNKRIRYYKDISTKVYLLGNVEHLSFSASAKNPWQMFILHFRQIFIHFNFYAHHPAFLLKKVFVMVKLILRSIVKLFY